MNIENKIASYIFALSQVASNDENILKTSEALIIEGLTTEDMKEIEEFLKLNYKLKIFN